jgi:hypothetical protein
MSAASERPQQVSTWKVLLSSTDPSEILAHADELLLFLNRLKDVLSRRTHAHISISSLDDIIYGLESNPEATLQDKSVRARLFNLFMKFNEY